MAADGTITWLDELPGRYLYILEEGSSNPGVPPNFDMPDGVIWRVDTPHTETPFESGVAYGTPPTGTVQKVPAESAPAPALTSGQTYHLYVLYDVALPISRCLFTAP